MKKFLILALMLLVGISLLTPAFADEARYISKKSKAITASEVTSTAGVVLFKVTGYAGSANSVYGLYNCSTLLSVAAATCKIEGGEASQYDSIPTLDFGEEGIHFDNGLCTVVSGAYLTIEYI